MALNLELLLATIEAWITEANRELWSATESDVVTYWQGRIDSYEAARDLLKKQAEGGA
jgi:hypothetical protein